MTVKELKEQLNKFDDNLIVMIPKADSAEDLDFPYRAVSAVAQGVNECDGCVFLEDMVCCETCVHDDCELDENPCRTCNNYSAWDCCGE